MFTLIVIVFILIGIVAFYGDYEKKELEREYEKYKEVCGRDTDKATKSK